MKIDNNIRYLNNTSFKAKLDFKKWAPDIYGHELISPERWSKIAEEFEKQTQEYPDDVLIISYPYLEYRVINNKVSLTKKETFYNSEHLGKINKLKDNELVDKLVKLHNLFRIESEMYSDAFKFMENMQEKYGLFKLYELPRQEAYGWCGSRAHSTTDEFISSLVVARTELKPDLKADVCKDDILSDFLTARTSLNYKGMKIF